MSNALESHVHRFVPGPGSTTFLLLHGTGGDESAIVPLGAMLDPDAALLSPRGNVLEQGMPRFFRRFAEGIFDEEDLVRRTHELAAFIEAAELAYGIDPRRLTAVGYSNGANIAASLLLLRPRSLARAVLFRAMLPLEPAQVPELGGVPVYLGAGRHDPIVPAASVERLATLLNAAGAEVTLRWENAGHELVQTEIPFAREWLLA